MLVGGVAEHRSERQVRENPHGLVLPLFARLGGAIHRPRSVREHRPRPLGAGCDAGRLAAVTFDPRGDSGAGTTPTSYPELD